MRIPESLLCAGLSSLILSIFSLSNADAQVVYQESFTTNPGNLNGRTTAAGFGNWVTSDSALQVGDGLLTVNSNSPDDYHSATFALPVILGSNTLQISITTRPAGTGFLGIGFTDHPGQFVINNGLSWLYINGVGTGAPGNVEIFRGMGSADQVYNGTPTDFDASLPTTYTFIFNPTAKTMGLSATNGTNSIVFFSALDIGDTSAAVRNLALQFQGQNLSMDSTASYISSVRAEVVSAPTDNYTTWLTNYPELGANTNGTDDPDGDGMDNNAEFAFGTSPVSGASRAATLSTGTGTIKLIYLQRISGATYTVKSLPDLTTPFDSGTTLSFPDLVLSSDQSNLPSSDYQRYEATLNTGSTKGFLRVRATFP